MSTAVCVYVGVGVCWVCAGVAGVGGCLHVCLFLFVCAVVCLHVCISVCVCVWLVWGGGLTVAARVWQQPGGPAESKQIAQLSCFPHSREIGSESCLKSCSG